MSAARTPRPYWRLMAWMPITAKLCSRSGYSCSSKGSKKCRTAALSKSRSAMADIFSKLASSAFTAARAATSALTAFARSR